MKKKSSGWFAKLVLVLVFLAGLCMMANIAMMSEETEVIEGIVEHTYTSGAHGKNGGTIASTPMCRVVWYDKDGEKVVYGMPNDREYVVAFILGIIMCLIVILIWRCKFGARKEKKTPQIDPMDRKRKEAYNPIEYTAVIKASICNGEQVAGFKNKKTGQFTEVMLIRGDKDLEEFKKRYGVEDIKKEY